MRIDVHTHISPDRIAAPVLENMSSTFGYPAVGVNTIDGILLVSKNSFMEAP